MYAISSWHSGLADWVHASYAVLGNFFIFSSSLKLLCVCVKDRTTVNISPSGITTYLLIYYYYFRIIISNNNNNF